MTTLLYYTHGKAPKDVLELSLCLLFEAYRHLPKDEFNLVLIIPPGFKLPADAPNPDKPYRVAQFYIDPEDPEASPNLWTNALCRTILAGLANCPPGPVALCEHDCLYEYHHFLLLKQHYKPPLPVYNLNVVLLDERGFYDYDPRQTHSHQPGVAALRADQKDKELVLRFTLSASMWDRDRWIRHFANSLYSDRINVAEPHIRKAIKVLSKIPVIDIRHGHNTTGARAPRIRLTRVPGWGRPDIYTHVLKQAKG